MGFICRICENDRDNKKHLVREMYFGTREEFPYFECSRCGCLQLAEIPDDMSSHYPAAYYSFAASGPSARAGKLKSFASRKRNEYALFERGILGKLLYAIRRPTVPFESLRKFKTLKKETVLDVGCGAGQFARYLTELGIDVTGIDPFIERDLVLDDRLKILKRTLVDFKRETDLQFDLIMFNHSFEHMPDPEEALKAASELIRSSGTIMIRIPTVTSYAWKHYRTDWVQLDAPRHLFLHSMDSMRILAEKSGLTVGAIAYDSDELQFCGSEQYLKDIPLMSPRSYRTSLNSSPFTRKEIARYRKQAVELNRQNLGDMAAFYLDKP